MCGASQARILEWVVISFLTCKSRYLEPMHLRGMCKAGVGPSGRDATGSVAGDPRRGEQLASWPVRRMLPKSK